MFKSNQAVSVTKSFTHAISKYHSDQYRFFSILNEYGEQKKFLSTKAKAEMPAMIVIARVHTYQETYILFFLSSNILLLQLLVLSEWSQIMLEITGYDLVSKSTYFI